MRKIYGVLGEIKPEDLGTTLMHEHITCADWSMRMNFGDKFFDFDRVTNYAVEHFERAKDVGIKTIVEGSPINLGRDINLIRSVAEKTGLNFIASTGLFHNRELWLIERKLDDIYDLMSDECKSGIAGTDSRPGIMKCATASDGVTPFAERLLAMLGTVAAENELSVFCHHDARTKCGTRMIEVLENAGVPANRIIIGHSGDSDDFGYLREIASEGCYVSSDRFGYPDGTLESRIKTIIRMKDEGFLSRLLLSHDLSAYMAFFDSLDESLSKRYLWDDKDFTYISNVVLPLLKDSGFTEDDVAQLMIRNPVNCLTE